MPERDWARVQTERCDECGLDAAAVPVRRLPDAVRSVARRWRLFLMTTPATTLRRRPRPDYWSALEYAAHTRDVLRVFAERVELALATDDPGFGWWDHEAAVLDEHYNDQDIEAVAAVLESNADLFATILAAVPVKGWTRAGRRRDSEQFTVAGLARFALHEAHHHLQDAERAAT
jgi:DinB family protein